MNRPQIIIVDNNLSFRQCLKNLFTVENIASVIGEASNDIEFMDVLTKNKPDLVLMSFPLDPKNRTAMMKKALLYMPDLKIIAFTMFGNEESRAGMIELGVKGFLQKSCYIDEYIKAFYFVTKGENYFSNKRDTFN